MLPITANWNISFVNQHTVLSFCGSLHSYDYPVCGAGIVRMLCRRNSSDSEAASHDGKANQNTLHDIDALCSTSGHAQKRRDTGRDNSAITRLDKKVSLRRYRRASVEVMRVLQRFVPEDKLERASVDEAYADLTDQCRDLLRTRDANDLAREVL